MKQCNQTTPVWICIFLFATKYKTFLHLQYSTFIVEITHSRSLLLHAANIKSRTKVLVSVCVRAVIWHFTWSKIIILEPYTEESAFIFSLPSRNPESVLCCSYRIHRTFSGSVKMLYFIFYYFVRLIVRKLELRWKENR